MPSKEVFYKTIMQMYAERQKRREKEYLGYVTSAVSRMKPKRSKHKRRGCTV